MGMLIGEINRLHCENLLRYGPATQEFTRLQWTVKNWHIWPNMSANTRPIFTKFLRLIDIWVEMINLTFVSRIFNYVHGWIQKLTYTTFILCTGVPWKFEYRYANVCIKSGDDSATLHKNLVKFGTVTPEIEARICTTGILAG